MNTEINGIILMYLLVILMAIPLGKYIGKIFNYEKTWVDNKSAYFGLIDYLGLDGKEHNNCSLKGFMIRKEKKGKLVIGTELEGTWFSGRPTLGVVTDLVEGYRCDLSIVNPKGTIDRVYKYRIIPINPEETNIELEMIQYYALSLFQILNPHVTQLTFSRILKGVLPFEAYDEVEKILPKTLLNSIANDAFPDYIKKVE